MSALYPKALAAELREPQLIDVLVSAGDFLYDKGVGEGAVGCDAAVVLCTRAAAMIDSLQEENERLRAGLERIATHDWTEPPAEMPDEMARAVLNRPTNDEGETT